MQTLPTVANGNQQLALADNSTAQKTQMSAAMQMVQMQFQVAQMIPRDVGQCTLDLMEACKDLDFVEQPSILYAWDASGKTVCGPGIRLIEEAARCYGSIGFEWQIVDSGDRWTMVKTTAVDFKKNIAASRTFVVKHGIMKKVWENGKVKKDAKGKDVLEFDPITDEDQIYVRIANYAARRKRTCLEEVMPKIMLTKAFKQAQETLKAAGKTPIPLRIAAAFESLANDYGIPREIIEGKYKKPQKDFDANDLVELRAIWSSIKAEPAKKLEFFPALAPKAPEAVDPAPEAEAAPKPQESTAESAKQPDSTTADATKEKPAKEKPPKKEPKQKTTELASETKTPATMEPAAIQQNTEPAKEPEQSPPPVVTPQGLPERVESFLDDDDLDSIGGFSS